MSKRWAQWVQLAYPLSDKDKENMIGACDAEYAYANNNLIRLRVSELSPAEQFDESHHKWLEGGREC